jgi:hypothetical protein
MLRLVAISSLIVFVEMLVLSGWHPQNPRPMHWHIGENIRS